MASNGTITVADLDADLAELNKRAGNCRELIHRALLELASIDYRTEVLLERRYALSRIWRGMTITGLILVLLAVLVIVAIIRLI